MDQETVRHIHTTEYYSALKKRRKLAICDNIGESVESIMIREIKPDRERQVLHGITNM